MARVRVGLRLYCSCILYCSLLVCHVFFVSINKMWLCVCWCWWVCDEVRVGVWECVWVRINISGRYNCITMWYESCMCSGKCRVWWAKDWPTLAMRVPNLYILLCWVDPGTQVLEVAHLLNCIAFGCPERWVIREDIICDDLTLLCVRHEPKHGIFLLHSFQEFLGLPHWVDIRQISSA